MCSINALQKIWFTTCPKKLFYEQGRNIIKLEKHTRKTSQYSFHISFLMNGLSVMVKLYLDCGNH